MHFTMLGPNLIRCSLCQGALPASNDEVFLGHMRDQHRAYFDLDFMFAVFCLIPADKDIISELVNERIAKKSHNAKVKNKPTKDEDTQAKIEVPSNVSVTSIKDNGSASDVQESDESKKLFNSQHDTEDPVSLEEKPFVGTKNPIQKTKPKQEYIPENNKVSTRRRRSKFNAPLNLPGFCKDCGKDTKQLGYHRQREHGTVSICDLCNVSLNSLTKLKIHKRRFHMPSSPCPDCGKLVKKMTLHRKTQHTNNEDKKWRCLTCGKGFAVRFALIEHERIHGEKQFLCRVSNGLCGKASTSPGNRTKHEALCKYWENLEDIKTEESKNAECEVEVKVLAL